MINVLDEKVTHGPAVRGLMYDDANELKGPIVDTDIGPLECSPGSVAMKCPFGGFRQLDHDGTWKAKTNNSQG